MVQGSVPHLSDIPKNATLIALSPYLDQSCAEALMQQAQLDNARLLLLVDSGKVSRNQMDFPEISPISVLLVPGATGASAFHYMSVYSSNDTVMVPGTSINSTVERVGVQIQVEQRSGIPRLWIVVLVILAAILVLMAGMSLVLNMIQWRRRKDLLRRIRRGEVDIEQLGIKRLTLSQEILDKIPLRTYIHGEQHFRKTSDAKMPAPASNKHLFQKFGKRQNSEMDKEEATTSVEGFSQTNCPVCLEDFEDEVTQVRQLRCDHIYHVECIDEYLKTRSSRCPLCKQSTVPLGYFPEHMKLTNTTVRLEREMRAREQRQGTSSSNHYASDESSIRLESLRGIEEGAISSVSGEPHNAPRNTPSEAPPPHRASGPFHQESMVFAEEAENSRPIPRWRRVLGHLFPT